MLSTLAVSKTEARGSQDSKHCPLQLTGCAKGLQQLPSFLNLQIKHRTLKTKCVPLALLSVGQRG
ncbi:hypothetical protein [Nostoc sp.]|uniref:hypothetical protein n=1 Tax=Nostoc sp. TaxID=1180 RepID=UPI002FF67BA4